MEKLVIEGGNTLKGKVKVSGSKNASLPIIAATILCDGEYKIDNVPNLRDVRTLLKLLSLLDIEPSFNGNEILLKNKNDDAFEAPYDLVKTMRASILVLGPLLAKRRKARVSLPGGCAIGERPVDQHIKALKQMGANINIEHGYIVAECDRLKGADIYFDLVTVTGTENVLMAAVLAEGKTTIYNAAIEPEVIDLANFLKKMGAKIEGIGTKTITVYGVDSLSPANYSVMNDRIEAATLMCAAAITGGDVEIEGVPQECLTTVFEKLSETGVSIDFINDKRVRVSSTGRLKAADVTTQVYPGFPTDLQAQFMALMCVADGVSVITETIFENRFMHVAELKRMGADIRLKDRSAVVNGVEKLSGAHVMASDLRASASLVIAGLVADGETHVHRIYHLDRGYERFDEKLNSLGAKIKREENGV
ncbi:UDP-N-acetylglucosamine 1-carboxyvinyltransferase [Deferribacter autotrophicus]|uniref:UDP-N-acetylglucosamine 1-carboxyvinyltransferase n=1 Tax=Deferribacter autotrophicus TaxID=500465 RepID=A0A5A8F1E4_9BACT|nr:UDP-N-acetylglucosamine 1-carboxyvinyltransferase [Deferribacter autotrophicus]KAA0257730.1 UDP-N-acetylglucosamine 1-carboxyvinyltransferase [Deferribacter autotrophicus]